MKKTFMLLLFFFGTKIQFRVEFSPNDKQQYRRGGEDNSDQRNQITDML